MNEAHEAEICRAALNKWGRWHQSVKAVEEMAELTQEICKRLGGRENNARLAEELADVEITFAQLKMAYGIEDEVPHWKDIKLRRLRERIEEDEE